MSQNQYGLPLAAPSTQTVLPVLTTSGNVVGFFPIASTTFAGTEKSFVLADGSVPITTVTLAPKNLTNVNDEQRVEQFMAAQWPEVEDGLTPWLGYTELVYSSVPNTLGFYSRWALTPTKMINFFGRGVYLDSLKFSLADFVNPSAASPGNPQVTTPQALRWATSIDMAAFDPNCAFFDFSWTTLFNAKFNPDTNTQNTGNFVVPQSISIQSNPAGGYFKASVVTGQGGQTISAGGGAVFDTIRILRLQDPPAGTYTFSFLVTMNTNGVVTSTPATLNLTVV
jgi:hypothetical protein